MSQTTDKLRNYWQNLRTREKLLLGAATVVFMIFLGYFVAVRPLTAGIEQLSAGNIRLHRDLLTIKNYQGNNLHQPATKKQDRTVSVEKAVDLTGKKYVMPITKISRQGKSTSVDMSITDSASLLYFLSELERTYGIQVQTLEIEPSGEERIKVKGLLLGRKSGL